MVFVDVTSRFHNYTAKLAPNRASTAAHTPKKISPFVDSAIHVASELLNVKCSVKQESTSSLLEMRVGTACNEERIQRTEQLISGVALHVNQMRDLLPTALRNCPDCSKPNSQAEQHLRAIVAVLFELLQESATAFASMKNAVQHHTVMRERFRLGDCIVTTNGPAITRSKRPVNDRWKQQHVDLGSPTDVTPVDNVSMMKENLQVQRLVHSNDMDIAEVEQSVTTLIAISTVFSNEVERQNEQIEKIHDNAQQSTDFLQQANQYLKQTAQRKWTFPFIVFWVINFSTLIMLFLHMLIP